MLLFTFLNLGIQNVMKLLDESLHMGALDLDYIGVEGIKLEGSVHRSGRKVKVLTESVANDISGRLGEFVSNDYVGVRLGFLGKEDKRTRFVTSPLPIGSVDVHEEVCQSSQSQGLGKDVRLVGLLVVVCGRISNG